MRITVLGHCYVVSENRVKWKRFAKLFPETRVTLLAPRFFKTDRYGFQEYIIEPEKEGNYCLVPLRQTEWMRGLYLESGIILKESKPDIFVITEEVGNWVTFQCLLWRKIWASKVLALAHSNQNIRVALTKRYHIWRDKNILHSVNAMFAENEEAVRLLRARGFTKPILISLDSSVDEQVWHPDQAAGLIERRRYGLQGFVIGYVGALREEKGIVDLVSAVSHLRGDWQLLLVGDGPLRPQIETVARQLGVRNRLHLAGFVPRHKTPALYRCMDVLVLPSRTTPTCKEQFGVVLVEAMLSRVAVVGSSSGAIPEVIGKVGLLFPEGDRAALGSCLQRLHDDSVLRKELAGQGLKRALDKYCATTAAKQAYSFFSDLLSEYRLRRR